jgi:hypothetical protein
MKKSSIFLPALLMILLLNLGSCSKDPKPPCDGQGQICITNKLDSTVIINIVQNNQLISIDKDNMKCLTLPGEIAYTFNITMNTYYKDTTILITDCDYKNYIIQKPLP